MLGGYAARGRLDVFIEFVVVWVYMDSYHVDSFVKLAAMPRGAGHKSQGRSNLDILRFFLCERL